jgi:hypothetical protein
MGVSQDISVGIAARDHLKGHPKAAKEGQSLLIMIGWAMIIRTVRIIRLLAKIQHVFYVPDEIARYLSDTPTSL